MDSSTEALERLVEKMLQAEIAVEKTHNECGVLLRSESHRSLEKVRGFTSH